MAPRSRLDPDATRALVARLWRDQVRHHPRRIAAALACTALVAGLTALYPVVIQQAFDSFATGDARIVTVVPFVIVAVTVAKAMAQYGQAVAISATC